MILLACLCALVGFVVFEICFVELSYKLILPEGFKYQQSYMPGDKIRRSIQSDIVKSLASDDWSQVQSKFQLMHTGLIVGDASGVRFQTTRGWQSLDLNYAMGSHSKYLTGITIARAIEVGNLTYDSKPQEYFSSWPLDSAVTLGDLVSFTTGFKAGTLQGCARAPKAEQPSWEDCINEIAQYPMPHAPGTTYQYGPYHLAVAAGMAQASMGRPLTTEAWKTTVGELVYQPCGITDTPDYTGIQSDLYGFLGPENRFPDFAGGMRMNARQWQKIMGALQYGNLLSEQGRVEFDRDRTANVKTWLAGGNRPNVGGDDGLRAGMWHYASGHWKSCDLAAEASDESGHLNVTEPEQHACVENDQQLFHSTGVFGWYAWYDLDNNFYAVFAKSWSVSLINTVLIFTCLNLLVVTPIIGIVCFLLLRKTLVVQNESVVVRGELINALEEPMVIGQKKNSGVD